MKAASQRVSESASQPGGEGESRVRTRHFRELIAWQKAMLLARHVYALTAEFPKAEQYGLVSQMRRCSVSMPSNIAEGHGGSRTEGFVFFWRRLGDLCLSLRRNCSLHRISFCTEAGAQGLMDDCNEVARIINGLLKKLEDSSLEGKSAA